ncbi:M61 family metallopeptidase [Ideonella livida]|uniref:M61 family metallopeptidase n=1 Tax=Ideonella livida TaxID=2707176 RepID=A0A7C9TLF7_9BURK|nr:PDZ domain-containing protein [Ideonella livida]NDY91547.1 M61 family metallopeptidase [Ideonella livida]
MITFRVDVAQAAAHRFAVTLTVPQPPARCRLSLPTWIPGSYMVREFARHLGPLEARQGEAACAVRQLDKCTWDVACEGSTALVLRYEVYAFDNSVRCAWLEDCRGFFNPTSLCLRVEGREDEPHELRLGQLPRGWDVAVALPPGPRPRTWKAADYDELADSPVELGPFWRGRFEACGVPHEFVVAGAWPGMDGERLLADTQRLCEAQIRFWHGKGRPPFARYVFMLNAVEEGYGGLEHRASTALIANRRDLPRTGMPETSEGYQTLLGLISHEYFHTWNVKRLKPREFLRYDYARENYTELLWFFEGFTSYYDDLFLRRVGLMDTARYLKALARTVNGVAQAPGQAWHSVAQASFDAWVKYYRPDENSPNATVSYYTKGSLVALLLDLRLRAAGAAGLDAVMRRLWKGSLRHGVTEAAILAAVSAEGGPALAGALIQWVHGRDPLPLAPALEAMGVSVTQEATALAQRLGLRMQEGAEGLKVKVVLRGGLAEAAGLSAGDELLAADGWRLRRLEDLRQWVLPTQACELTVVRGQRLRTLRLAAEQSAEAAAGQQVRLGLQTPSDAEIAARRLAWLGE